MSPAAGLAEGVRHLAQDGVADVVAALIVDDLEVVEVDQGDRRGWSARRLRSHSFLSAASRSGGSAARSADRSGRPTGGVDQQAHLRRCGNCCARLGAGARARVVATPDRTRASSSREKTDPTTSSAPASRRPTAAPSAWLGVRTIRCRLRPTVERRSTRSSSGWGRVPGGVDHDDLRVHVESEVEAARWLEAFRVSTSSPRTSSAHQRAPDGTPRAGPGRAGRARCRRGPPRQDPPPGTGRAQGPGQGRPSARVRAPAPRLDQGERGPPADPRGRARRWSRPATPVLPHLTRELQQLLASRPARRPPRGLVEPDPATDHRLARIVGEHASLGEGQAQDPGRALDRSFAPGPHRAAGRQRRGRSGRGTRAVPVPQQASADLHVVDLELARLEREQADAARGQVVPHARVALGVDAGENRRPTSASRPRVKWETGSSPASSARRWAATATASARLQ